MDDYKRMMLLSFHDEIEKTAVNLGGIGKLISGAGARAAALKGAKSLDMASGGAGVGAGAGGLAGAGVEGYRGYQNAKEQGATTGQAIAGGIGKGLVGAAAGAAGGALLGAGGGALASRNAKATELAGQATKGKWNPIGALSRGVKRQVHGATGYADTQQLRAMKGGAYDAVEEHIDAAKELGVAAKSGNHRLINKAKKEFARTQKGQEAAQKAEDMGLHSIPGYAKSLVKNPLDTIRAGAAEQWHTSGTLGKAMAVGSPLAAVGGELITPTEQGGPGKAERTGRELAQEAFFAASPLPIGAGLLAAGAIGQGGKYLGRGVDYATQRIKGAGNA